MLIEEHLIHILLETKSKTIFLDGIKRICDDGRTRFLVPEVNSGAEDLKSIIKDIVEFF